MNDPLIAELFHKEYTGLVRYAEIMYRKCGGYVDPRGRAEEIVQETFLRAIQHANKLPDDANLDAWLFRIARNVHISRLRKRQREVGDAALDVAPSSEDVESGLADQEQALHILRNLHTLEEPYKEVFTLRALGDMGYRELAALFGKTESWARVTYHRARPLLS
jgi:RNA polymerase sigma-70 factor (ECF subfamily)